MARVSVSLFGVFATVVMLGVHAQAAATAPVPPQDSVVGGGARGIFRDISIDAHSDPLGGSPSGTVSFIVVVGPIGPVPIGGPVTCLAVDGNRAVIGFNDTTTGVGPVTVVVTDNGSTGSPPDEFEASPQATDCLADPGFGAAPLTVGDIVVRDAPSKDQCRNGGWRNFTDAAGQPFRNQGECIAFALGTS
jgi:hypothetical protein